LTTCFAITVLQVIFSWYFEFGIGCRSHTGRACRPQVWRAVWFLILLFYAPLLHTCIALLKCPVIASVNGGDHVTVGLFVCRFSHVLKNNE